MASQSDYFANREDTRPKEKYRRGERVFGQWNKIPFIADVVRDLRPGLLVHTDLPVQFEDKLNYILRVEYKDVKRLVEY
jgi:hypothetical protein